MRVSDWLVNGVNDIPNGVFIAYGSIVLWLLTAILIVLIRITKKLEEM
jgi:hypothetical protein